MVVIACLRHLFDEADPVPASSAWAPRHFLTCPQPSQLVVLRNRKHLPIQPDTRIGRALPSQLAPPWLALATLLRPQPTSVVFDCKGQHPHGLTTNGA